MQLQGKFMKKLEVKFKDKSKNYNILIEKGILKDIKTHIDALKKYNNCFVITNKTVWKLYKKYFEGFKNVVVIEDGEKYKNFETYKYILDELLCAKIERDDVILALGGGVTGDIAGFAASTVLRGVDFIQIPTTLLAQVDSSVGGKVAINHKTGKNLIGAFYQPKLVLIDPNTLKTLDERQIKAGLGEVVKYAFIEKNCGEKSSEFFNFLMNCNIKSDYDLEEIIYHACKLKAYVVSKDEKEKSLRAVLNFGHTFAHGIEKVTNYKVFTHGEAVALGIKMALKLGVLKGLIKESYYKDGIKLLEKFNLQTDLDKKYSREKILKVFLSDKKVKNGKITFVLPVNVSSVGLYQDIEDALIKESLL